MYFDYISPFPLPAPSGTPCHTPLPTSSPLFIAHRVHPGLSVCTGLGGAQIAHQGPFTWGTPTLPLSAAFNCQSSLARVGVRIPLLSVDSDWLGPAQAATAAVKSWVAPCAQKTLFDSHLPPRWLWSSFRPSSAAFSPGWGGGAVIQPSHLGLSTPQLLLITLTSCGSLY